MRSTRVKGTPPKTDKLCCSLLEIHLHLGHPKERDAAAAAAAAASSCFDVVS